MSVWNSFVEWYLGVSPAGPGEGTQWHWLMQPVTPAGWPAWLSVVTGAAVILGLYWSYRRDAVHLGRWQRWILTALRFAAIVLALGLWALPTVTVARSGLPPVVVLIDTSASMSQSDLPPSRKTGAASPGSGPTRWQLMQTALQADGVRFLKDLKKRHPVRFYQFSSTATPLQLESSDQAADDDMTAWAKFLSTLNVDGAATRPAEAVRQVLAELRGMPPTAMIVLTDGIPSESESDALSKVASTVRRRGTSLYIVPVGDSRPPRDLQLFDVVMDEVAFVGDPVLISGKLKASGLTADSVVLKVTAEGREEPLVTQSIRLGSAVARPNHSQTDSAVETNSITEVVQKFELLLTPAEAAELDLTILAEAVAGETSDENNRELRHLSVREEKLSVLLLESTPRYEFRYLKQWLERDPSVTLQTLLLDADPEYSQEDRTAVAYFPVQKDDLLNYDVVILGDVSPSRLGLTAAAWLTDFVREKGGGLILIAGQRHNPSALINTPLEVLLPFPTDAVDLTALAKPATDEYQPRLTLDGQKGVPMFRFAESEQASIELWNQLPGFYGLLPIRKVKPGVRILVEHPYASAEQGRRPVITLQQIGNGKVLFHGSDETWRWRFRMGDTYFGKYWGQAIRYLSRSRLLGKDRSIELLVDRQTYLQGEPVLIRARFLDDRLTPASDDGVSVVLERRGGERQEVILSRLPHLPTVFEATLPHLLAGKHHAWLSRPSVAVSPPVVDFRIESLQKELQHQPVDRHELRAAAEATDGELVELSALPGLAEKLPEGRLIPMEQGHAIPLWSRWEPLLLLAGLLMTEWTLRRRWRML